MFYFKRDYCYYAINEDLLNYLFSFGLEPKINTLKNAVLTT